MISILIALIIVGAILYILQMVPIDPTIKRIGYVIIVVLLCIWLLQTLGGVSVLPLR